VHAYFYRCGVFENYSYFYCSINFTELNVVLLPHHADVVCLDGIVDACNCTNIKIYPTNTVYVACSAHAVSFNSTNSLSVLLLANITCLLHFAYWPKRKWIRPAWKRSPPNPVVYASILGFNPEQPQWPTAFNHSNMIITVTYCVAVFTVGR